jgi:acetyl esterase/lipase
MTARLFLFCLFLFGAVAAAAQGLPAPQTFRLWENGAPGTTAARRGEAEMAEDYWVRNVHNPSVTVFPADPRNANGASVVVIPGGGHRLIVWTTEGTAVAQALNRMGITVFVLKYRLAREEGSAYSIEGDAAADARRAIRYVRANAARYGLDPTRVGAMGFSAGGELVSLIADNRAAAAETVRDAVDRQSARPDFQILVFPGPLGVPGNAVEGAPPAFLISGSVDECCAAPTVALYEQLRRAGVSAELHMYANAGHAFNLGEQSNQLAILHWPERLHDWMSDSGFLTWRAPQAANPR